MSNRHLSRRQAIGAAAAVALTGTSIVRANAPQEATPTMAHPSTFVLVHGSWLGPWCWDKVTPHIEASGHTVITVELPGHGDNQTPIQEISLDSYVAAVGAVLESQTRPVILVGHSMAGAVISLAGERWPECIEKLVYLAAYLLESGQSIFQIAGADADAKIGPYLVIKEAKGEISVKPEGFIEVFCPDAPAADAEAALARLRSEPLGPLATPIETTLQGWGSLPRAYIKTTEDRVFSPATQDLILSAIPCQHVVSVATGHSPFIPAPELLATTLTKM